MLSFPLNIGEPEITEDALQTAYDLAASADTGGMYPVGANSRWHGGVHLQLGAERPVYACVPGTIVAARLDPDEERATCEFGHTNFILTKHTWPPTASAEEGTPFFVLYMHLAPKSLETVAGRADVAPWLTGEPLLRVTADSGLTVRYRPRPGASREGAVPNGALLKPKGEPSERGGYRWQEIGALDRDLEGFVALGPLKSGQLRERWTEEAPAPGESDLVGTLEDGGVAKPDVPVEGGEMLWWSGAFGRASEHCEEFQKVMDEAHANAVEMMGEGVDHPELINRAPSIHWEVFSGEKIFGAGSEDGAGSAGGDGNADGAKDDEESSRLEMPSWTTTVSSKNKRVFAPEACGALSLIEERREASEIPDPTAYRSCDLGKKKSVHFLEAGKALRRYAVKNVSEWGIKDMDRAVERSRGIHKSEKEDLKALQWWDEAEAAGVDLPDSRKVWHYHPVTALKAIAAQKPQFFVEAGGERRFVDRYEEMRDAIFEANDVSAGTVFDVPENVDEEEETDQKEAKSLLNSTTVKCLRPDGATEELVSGAINLDNGWAGVATKGDGASLYEMLIDPASETGIPEMADIHKNVWAALTPVEGHLNAVNAYDNAFLSFGPIQQTLGKEGDKGELQGALEAVRLRAPDRYEEHFGQHGLLPTEVEPSAGVKKGHFALRGEPINGPSGKSKLQAFRWLYRFKQAIEDTGFREAFLRYGFERLSSILQHSVSFEYEVDGQTRNPTWQIGDLFRSDLGRALLLDTHINGPFYVWSSSANIWREKAESRLEEWETESLPITKSQERQLILDLIDQRNRSGMWQPPVRAAKVLYYTELDTIHDLVVDAGYSDARRPKNVTDEERNAFLDEKIGLASTDPNGMDDFSAPVLVKGQVKAGNRVGEDRYHNQTLSFERSDLLTLQSGKTT